MKKIPEIFVCTSQESALVTKDQEIIDAFILHNRDSELISFTDSADEADLVILFENWSFKLANYSKKLLTDPFFVQHSEKLYVINYDDTVSEPFLPGCYVSLKLSCYDHQRFASCAYPKIYNNHLSNVDLLGVQGKNLYWFRGTPQSHSVRRKIFDALADSHHGLMVDVSKNFHTHGSDDKSNYAREMSDCQFVLCPRGHSPNSYRLYEAMSIGKCPVIISDEWVETEGPDWSSCSIRIAEKDISKIENILLERRSEASTLGENARSEWLKYFTQEAKNKMYLQQILQLSRQTHLPTKTAKEYKSYWRSPTFLTNNSWSLKQKLKRKFKTLLN